VACRATLLLHRAAVGPVRCAAAHLTKHRTTPSRRDVGIEADSVEPAGQDAAGGSSVLSTRDANQPEERYAATGCRRDGVATGCRHPAALSGRSVGHCGCEWISHREVPPLDAVLPPSLGSPAVG